MSIVVETGAGLEEANSFASVAFADSYHSARGKDSWAAATQTKKEAALVVASDYVDAKYRSRWIGTKTKDSQSLTWPRYGAVTAEGGVISSTYIPVDIKRAVVELAGYVIDGVVLNPVSDAAKDKGPVTMEKVGDIEVQYAAPSNSGASKLPVFHQVEEFLSNYFRVAGGTVKLVRV